MQLSAHLVWRKGARYRQHSEENKKKLTTYLDRLEAHVEPKANTVFSWYKLHNCIEGEGETVEQFVTDFKLLARDCVSRNRMK